MIRREKNEKISINILFNIRPWRKNSFSRRLTEKARQIEVVEARVAGRNQKGRVGWKNILLSFLIERKSNWGEEITASENPRRRRIRQFRIFLLHPRVCACV